MRKANILVKRQLNTKEVSSFFILKQINLSCDVFKYDSQSYSQ